MKELKCRSRFPKEFIRDDEVLGRVRDDIRKVLVKVEASKLSLDDKFMQYTPKNNREASIKKTMKSIINHGIEDFWRPKYDPSFDEEFRILYVPGKKPAVGRNFKFWLKCFQNQGLQFGTIRQYIAFYGCQMKALIKIGETVEDAWHMTCTNSIKMGNYTTSNGGRYLSTRELEPTGSREICGFYDSGNTCY